MVIWSAEYDRQLRHGGKPRRGLPGSPANDAARVGVRELRQNLSVYLDRVKGGESLTVTEHGVVVAVLAPPPPASGLARMVAEGRAKPPLHPPAAMGRPRPAPVTGLSTGDVLRALGDERLP